jgi:hypothetical protein
MTPFPPTATLPSIHPTPPALHHSDNKRPALPSPLSSHPLCFLNARPPPPSRAGRCEIAFPTACLPASTSTTPHRPSNAPRGSRSRYAATRRNFPYPRTPPGMHGARERGRREAALRGVIVIWLSGGRGGGAWVVAGSWSWGW